MMNCTNIFEAVRGRTRIRDVFRRNKDKNSNNDVNVAFQSSSSGGSGSGGGGGTNNSKIAATHDQTSVRLDVAGPSHLLQQQQNLECCLCCHQKSFEDVVSLILCNHYACRECLESYLVIEITESRIDIACPLCPISIHPTGEFSFLSFFPFFSYPKPPLSQLKNWVCDHQDQFLSLNFVSCYVS